MDNDPAVSSSPAPSGTFTNFPRLPWELQQQIWLASIQDLRGRIVHITDNLPIRTFAENLRPAVVCAVSSTGCPPPPQLAACRDSRDLALKYYRPLLLGKLDPDANANAAAAAQDFVAWGQRGMRVDLEKDMLMLSLSGILNFHDQLACHRQHAAAEAGNLDLRAGQHGPLLRSDRRVSTAAAGDGRFEPGRLDGLCAAEDHGQHDACDMTELEENFVVALEMRNSFRRFVETHDAGPLWRNLTFRVVLAAVESPAGEDGGCLYARRLAHPAPVFGPDHQPGPQAGTKHTYVMRKICGGDGEILGRYEGVQRLFEDGFLHLRGMADDDCDGDGDDGQPIDSYSGGRGPTVGFCPGMKNEWALEEDQKKAESRRTLAAEPRAGEQV
ncbi:hypothetical protein MBM_07602 [Drepanopeziza brunnea f. sp. 'multigermtubi' MB_m1]|uniref:2EXR domain-containing protein n=1 Tax=Marssonina brunnea f. sp. multigermtubi (strain MB_m1) TaxID=1072389 RepID=K1WPR6_MARBU|nr:uncharacterized protein MBM_07602 [Drepanopeziza brunnea f. sp. 'multigermtubi' MB_m1]EKD14372.1 hypothetical protein MBM_07602 [Drepanopeziza brunnea f. sp. 'multigermtubi' MB_m1]